jgi:ATP-dependent DNA helicase RecG
MRASSRHSGKALGDQVALVHGRMSSDEKDQAMSAFKSGQTRLLVATTVIEVGVDVPDATIMVIEHAEHFRAGPIAPARGRVGRGAAPQAASCSITALWARPPARGFRCLRETEDGFRIAEEDLKLRGEGEVLGTRQSGMPGFRLANLGARRSAGNRPLDARNVLESDPSNLPARAARRSGCCFI